MIHIAADDYLFVPDGCTAPEGNSLPVIHQPHGDIYVAASSAMDLFDAIGSLDAVTLTSTDTGGWTLPAVQDAMACGDLIFIGKYSAPDYEALTESGCPLAIENTMISHSPAVREQIEALGIPVIVERSSYEQHPLGRMEWMKLYGLLLGKAEEAAECFAEKTAGFRALTLPDIPEAERKTVAFFSISANGTVNIRKPGDYISQMIGLAGGRYIFTADDLHIDENALSSMNIQMETFYAAAKDADILIYNSTIEGQLDSIAQLVIAGVMIGYICSALTDLAVTFADDANIVNLHNWSKGSFSGTDWQDIRAMTVLVSAALSGSFLLSKPISAYQLGEAYAKNMGVNIRVFRLLLILLSSALSACVTAFAGPVSFVGIAVPHLMKGLFGTAKPLILIPAAFLGRGVFCMGCDLIARTLFAPQELSVSTVTAVFGAPVVIYMMLQRTNERSAS